jgi:uncharacterized SAM-binding protein YcdF (DUF218 family)
MLRKLFLTIILIFSIIVIAPLAISVYLSPQDKLEKSDAIVVISGGDTAARINEGTKLYQESWAPLIIFSGAAATGDVSNALSMKRIAQKKGVAGEDILIEEKSKTTAENAKFVSEIVREKNIKSIILVTSPYHQRRANNEFREELGKDFKIINHSAKDDNWRKRNWWENANARFLTFGEIVKNFYGLIEGK